MSEVPRRRRSRFLSIFLVVPLTVGAGAWAGKGGEKGGGGKGGSKGGDITPVKITFRSELGAGSDGIAGDGLGPYVHDPDGATDDVQAYLGSGGAQGDIFLRLGDATARGLWLDFFDCAVEPCSPPGWAPGVDLVSSISVAAQETSDEAPAVKDQGLFGMEGGQMILAPMELIYSLGSPDGPGFVHFDAALKGRHPCKGFSQHVRVTRTPDDAQGNPVSVWTVSGDGLLACGSQNGSDQHSQYWMPFEFTVELLGTP